MNTSHILLAAALFAGAGCAAQAPAPPASTPGASGELATASKVCLRNELLWGYNVVNERTLKVTDRYNNRFTVRMRGGCIGLTNLAPNIRLLTRTALGCVGQGDRVFFLEPTLGEMSCTVIDVQADPPAAKAPA